ncbi:PAS domain-containing protein [Pandoraea sp. XY-2]|uniref:helix-turn-helix transcriptional regulator n=1 Tax=Pandoraea sp. XY-2 TaxID=2518599 RepID=UPI00101AF5C5|nr:helix-turn-helix transcriptional regulator [Pandoraea sp. XY-2]QBC31598.1 helix-turn-helix transcriptional regulator [Pandoraea sp. XY-2]
MDRAVDRNFEQYFDTAPGCWGCKNEKSVFMYANETYANLVGIRQHRDIIGRTDFDIPCKTIECAEDFQIQDKEVMSSNRALRVFDWHPYADGSWQAHIFTKTPMHAQDGAIIGTIFHGEDISAFPDYRALGPLLQCMKGEQPRNTPSRQTTYLIDSAPDDPGLTPRMREVLFFILRGWSAKMIAQVLSVSHRTIEMHVDVLRSKFGAHNRSELTDSGIALGYFNRIPESLFNQQLSVVLESY